jgi:hypothetical protein
MMKDARTFLSEVIASIKLSIRTPIVLDIYGDAEDMIKERDTQIKTRAADLACCACSGATTGNPCIGEVKEKCSVQVAILTGEY